VYCGCFQQKCRTLSSKTRIPVTGGCTLSYLSSRWGNADKDWNADEADYKNADFADFLLIRFIRGIKSVSSAFQLLYFNLGGIWRFCDLVAYLFNVFQNTLN